jgi:hypothetical protein
MLYRTQKAEHRARAAHLTPPPRPWKLVPTLVLTATRVLGLRATICALKPPLHATA